MADFDGKLLFWRPASGSGKLVFGDAPGGGEPVIPDAPLAVDADLPGLGGPVFLRSGSLLAAEAELPAMEGGTTLVWDANAARSTIARANPAFQQGQPLGAATRTQWQRSVPLATAHRPRFEQGAPAVHLGRMHWQRSAPLHATARPAFQQGLPQQHLVRGGFQQAIALRATARPAFQQGVASVPGWRLGFQQTIRLHRDARNHFQTGMPLQTVARAWLRTGTPLWRLHRPGFQQARYPLPGLTPPYVPPVQPPELCYDPARLGLLVFEAAYTGDGKLVFICHRSGGEPEQPPATLVVARRRSRIVINSIEVRRADTGQLLPALDSGFSMQLERGSWTWSFSVEFHGAALALLQPGVDGLPVELEVLVNGQSYRMLAETLSRSVQFPRSVVRAHGGGRSVLLDAPYAAQQSFMQESDRTAQQLMADALTINGVSMGWTLDWQVGDWFIPAGTWAHQGTWISAINDIASSVGAYVQPHDTAQVLRVLPAYPVRSWELASATPDIELPPGIAVVEEVEWIVKPAYDALYMHGEPGTSLFYRKRSGTPGTRPAPMAVHPLLVHADAAAQRAIADLSDTGRQTLQTLRTMVLPETGIIKPGLLLRYTDDADVVRTGITRAVSVAMAGPKLEQTIQVQAHE